MRAGRRFTSNPFDNRNFFDWCARLIRMALEKPSGLSEPGCGAGLALLALLSN